MIDVIVSRGKSQAAAYLPVRGGRKIPLLSVQSRGAWLHTGYRRAKKNRVRGAGAENGGSTARARVGVGQSKIKIDLCEKLN